MAAAPGGGGRGMSGYRRREDKAAAREVHVPVEIVCRRGAIHGCATRTHARTQKREWYKRVRTVEHVRSVATGVEERHSTRCEASGRAYRNV